LTFEDLQQDQREFEEFVKRRHPESDFMKLGLVKVYHLRLEYQAMKKRLDSQSESDAA
jgi:hypothetical protein